MKWRWPRWRREPDGEHARGVQREADLQLRDVRKQAGRVQRLVRDTTNQVQAADDFARAVEESLRLRRRHS